MRKILLGMLVISSLVLTSCLDETEDYSLDKVWISLGMVEDAGSGSVVLRLDDGSLLYPVAGEG